MLIIKTNNKDLKKIGENDIIYDRRISDNKNLMGLANYATLVIYDENVDGTKPAEYNKPKLIEDTWYEIEIVNAYTDHFTSSDNFIDLSKFDFIANVNYIEYILDGKHYFKKMKDKASEKLMEKFGVKKFSDILGKASLIMSTFDAIDEVTKKVTKCENITITKGNELETYQPDTNCPELGIFYSGEVTNLTESKMALQLEITCKKDNFVIYKTIWKHNKKTGPKEIAAQYNTAKILYDLGLRKVNIITELYQDKPYTNVKFLKK